jgi:hypothetical protein
MLQGMTSNADPLYDPVAIGPAEQGLEVAVA